MKQKLFKVIILAEKILRLDTSYFVKGGFWAFCQQIIGVTCGLVVSYFFGHYVSKAVFGEYNLILSYLGMLTFLSLPGMDNALTLSVSRGFDKSLITSHKLKLKYSFIGLPILLLIAFLGYRQQPQIFLGLLIAAILFPLINPFTNYPAFLTGKRRFSTLAYMAIAASIFFLLVMVSASRYHPFTPSLIAAYMLALIIPSLISYLYCLRYVSNNSVDPKMEPYGLFLTALSILPWVSGNLGNIILAGNLGVESLAIYAVANRFLTAVQKNFVVFYKPLTAKLATQNPKQHWETIKLHGWKLFGIGVLLMMFLWLSTPFLIRFFFTEKYSDAIHYGQLLSLALIPLPLSWVVGDMIIYQKKKLPQIITAVITPSVKIILLLSIIPLWKIYGLITVIILERFIELAIPLITLIKYRYKT